MSSYTSNLNLLKKDPTTDGNDTFNIKTMLNDNWDKIDNTVARHKKNIVYIEESQNWTVPSGVYEIAVFLIGGGSGGYGARCDEGYRSGRGGYGAYPNFGIIEVTPGAVIPVVIGAGGTGGKGRSSGGGGSYIPDGGGTSSFGSLLFAAGAIASKGAAEGGASVVVPLSGEVAKDGLAGKNNDSLNGTASRSSYCDITSKFYGGGGGSGCCIITSTQPAAGGAGVGGGGAGGSSGSLNGQNGTNYGGGGGGGGFCSLTQTDGKLVQTYGNGGNGNSGGCIIAY